MKSQFRYVAISPDRIEERKKIGPASFLHDFLVDRQTDAEGMVNYGKTISYAWIQSRWPDAPPLRTLQRHMARLKAAGLVWIEKAGWDEGMRVRVLGSAKWAQQADQMPLFPLPQPLSISRGKPVENLSNSGSQAPPKVAAQCRQKWRRNEVKNLREEKYKGNPPRSSPVEDAEALEKRRKFLEGQKQELLKKYKISC
jgi:hypothetical protein